MTTATTTLALAAAALFLGACEKDTSSTKDPGSDAAGTEAAPAGDVASGKKIKCFGVNACSGQAQCDVPDGRVAAGSKGHACAGQNECAKKGWIQLTASECTSQGGEPL
ncbi:MAG TPA: hypothetical protein VFG69_02995 [Nannocystaceae bacterium]|nr:hypothetical protein [Nannocystaceae bacterium]